MGGATVAPSAVRCCLIPSPSLISLSLLRFCSHVCANTRSSISIGHTQTSISLFHRSIFHLQHTISKRLSLICFRSHVCANTRCPIPTEHTQTSISLFHRSIFHLHTISQRLSLLCFRFHVCANTRCPIPTGHTQTSISLFRLYSFSLSPPFTTTFTYEPTLLIKYWIRLSLSRSHTKASAFSLSLSQPFLSH